MPYWRDKIMFQSLIGELQTRKEVAAVLERHSTMFQSLIGELQTCLSIC